MTEKEMMKFVSELRAASLAASSPDECVFCLSAEYADDLLPSLEKAAELLGYFCAEDAAQKQHMEDLADKASY